MASQSSPRSPKLEVRPSKMGSRRAAVFIGVHIVAALHIWHWKSTGSSVTPVEPSEAMQTLELGYVNAGFIFFALTILSTLIFGRWFCGWGCHVVALQDLCGAMLKRIGIRPKPIRSRLLMWVPVAAAFYMFVLPQIVRLWEGRSAPAWVWHLTTTDFWSTFPNLPIALLTFGVCGFLIVYMLGAKGFCTYGCPYGGIFYHVDRLAKGRIRVTDDCNQCGHCSAVCTSNVRVAQEVKLHRMVVDSGCMKCMDCVSVCPTGALYYGFKSRKGRMDSLPMVSSGSGSESKSQAIKYDFSWSEEFGLVVVFAASFYAFRGLYDAVPFLLAVGMASISAFTTIVAFRSLWSANVRFPHTQLKLAGKFTPAGLISLTIATGLIGLIVHSSLVQFNIHEGERELRTATLADRAGKGELKATISARNAERSLRRAIDLGWYPVSEWHYKLGVSSQFLGKFDVAIAEFSRALELNPHRPNTRLQLAHLLYEQKQFGSAITQFEKLLEAKIDLGELWPEYAQSQVEVGRLSDAIPALRRSIELESAPSAIWLNLGMALATKGEVEEGARFLKTYTVREPGDFRGFLNLGFLMASSNDFRDAKQSLKRGLELNPDVAPGWATLAIVEARLGSKSASDEAIVQAMRLAPMDPGVVMDLVSAIELSKSEREWFARSTTKIQAEREWSYFAAILAVKLGRMNEATQWYELAKSINPNLPPP